MHKYNNVLKLLCKVPCNTGPEDSALKVIEGIEMPRRSPFHIELSVAEAAELNRRAVRYTLPYFEVIRAKMILMAAQGIDNDEIAARLDTRREVVSQWRKRFFKDRLAGLDERVRPGRPRLHPEPAQR